MKIMFSLVTLLEFNQCYATSRKKSHYQHSVFPIYSYRKIGNNKVHTQQGTSFYIGNGRFVTNFHVVWHGEHAKGGRKVFIKYKDKIIQMEKLIHYSALYDLAVFQTNSKEIEYLKPLIIDPHSFKEDYQLETIPAFNYNKNMLIDLNVSNKDIFEDLYDVYILDCKAKSGMSGSPVLLKNKVVGILWSITTAAWIEKDLAVFNHSVYLDNLLKEDKNNCYIMSTTMNLLYDILAIENVRNIQECMDEEIDGLKELSTFFNETSLNEDDAHRGKIQEKIKNYYR